MTKSILRTLSFAAAVLLTTQAPAAPSSDFYLALLGRGTADVDAGRFEQSITPLRIAAFGLLESVEQYETAQVYLTIALDSLNRDDEARAAAQRVVAAERVEAKYATLRIPAGVRTKFEGLARTLLPAADVALLTKPAAAPQATTTAAAPVPANVVPEAPRKAALAASTTAGAVQTVRNGPPGPPAPQTASGKAPAATAGSTPPASAATTSAPRPESKPAQARQGGAPAPSAAGATLPPPRPAAVPAVPTASAAKAPVDVAGKLAAGERALSAANLNEARRIYRELLQMANHDHATWIRVAEGLYRSREFAGAVTAFERVGTLRPGEEAYRYYMAVSLYETGDFARAKRELAAAMPFIERTPDVERYRTRIEGAARP